MVNHKVAPFVLSILFIFGGLVKKTKVNNIVVEKVTLCDSFTTFKWSIFNRNVIPVRNKGSSPCIFSINPLKESLNIKEKINESSYGINPHFTK